MHPISFKNILFTICRELGNMGKIGIIIKIVHREIVISEIEWRHHRVTIEDIEKSKSIQRH